MSTGDAVADLDLELEHVLVDASESDDKASLLTQIESRRNCLRTAQHSVIVAGKPNLFQFFFLFFFFFNRLSYIYFVIITVTLLSDWSEEKTRRRLGGWGSGVGDRGVEG